MDLGQKLKEARTKAGLKQEELAKQLGVSRQTISNWENGRSLPDVGSALRLSDIYQMSLDDMLRDGDSVLKTFEDLVAKRRKFWQMMLEWGIILDILSTLLAGQNLEIAAIVCLIAGITLEYLSIFMHLRVFDHEWGEILRGTLGLILHIGCNSILRFTVPVLGISFLRILALGLIWSAGVFTIDWKSTRLWLIIVLFIGVPLLNTATALQDLGSFNEADPFGQQYQVSQVLHPEDGSVPEYTKIELSGSYLYISDRNGDRIASYGPFTYVQSVPGQTQKGIWQLIPDEEPNSLYKVTVESDDSIHLAYYEQDILQWKWLLTDYGRNTCFITVPTFGSTMQMSPDWYAPGRADPEPYMSRPDVVGSATLNIAVGGLETETLTLYEEYHHGGSTETAVYTLEPEKPGSFKLKLETRYDGENEWALYRIPYADGEYRFTLTFA